MKEERETKRKKIEKCTSVTVVFFSADLPDFIVS